jgi:hypothetical protein
VNGGLTMTMTMLLRTELPVLLALSTVVAGAFLL